MIDEYEQGIIHQENIEINHSYVVTTHTNTADTIKSDHQLQKEQNYQQYHFQLNQCKDTYGYSVHSYTFIPSFYLVVP